MHTCTRACAQTQWLLQALCQDQPKNKVLESFRDRCYRAALEGDWVSGALGQQTRPARGPRLRAGLGGECRCTHGCMLHLWHVVHGIMPKAHYSRTACGMHTVHCSIHMQWGARRACPPITCGSVARLLPVGDCC